MGVFDIFTGDPAKEAAEKQRAYYDQVKTQGNSTIDAGLGTSLAALTSGNTNARDALTTGYNTGTGAINTGADAALGTLGTGYNTAKGYLDQAGGAYSPLAALGTKYGAGTNLYMDSLGVNGSDGNARASAAFQPSQAYNFNLDQGLEAINRSRNARGMVNSGNTDRDAQNYGAGLASNEMKTWQDRLQGLISPELAATGGAASGQAGVYGQQATLANTYGQNQAGINTGRGAMLADLASRYGLNTAQNYAGEGTSLAGLNTGAANAKVGLSTGLAQPYAGTYKTEADAQMAANGNLWNMGMNVAKMAMGMPPIGGGMGSTLGSMGITYGMPGEPNSNLYGPRAP